MASTSSSSSSVLTPIVTQEEFKIFHNIDRVLYSRLVFNLNRDLAESMQVMALWLWLERSRHVGNLVNKILSFPDTLINGLADEALLCLNCIENDQFLLSFRTSDIPLIHFLGNTGLSLQFFHDNRHFIRPAVSKIVTEVCLRAFDDISQQAEKLKSKEVDKNKGVGKIRGQEMMKNQPCNIYVQPVMSPVMPVLYNSEVVGAYGPMGNGGGSYSCLLHGYDPCDLAIQTKILNNEIVDVLSHISMSDEVKDNVVPADDRTIFLTFSKGYPISEDEVRDFFTRKFGDCIEAIYMQELMGDQGQSLYARLVVKSPIIINVILEDKCKAKFSINGKHVWARKYIRKSPRLSSSPPPSQPTSPTAPLQQA